MGRRRDKKKQYCKRWLETTPPPTSPVAVASNYIHDWELYQQEHPDTSVILYLRESSRSQAGNLPTQENVLRAAVNAPVLAVCSEIVSGRCWDRPQLQTAVRQAQATDGAVIVAISVDRFVRPANYDKTRPGTTHTEADFEDLLAVTGDTPLATLLHPDMDPRQIRREQSRWGKEATGTVNVGRPRKKATATERQRARELYDAGVSLGDIALYFNRPRSTVQYWVR